MCLSTVYRDEMSKDNIAMRNVMQIDIDGDMVILTDLLEHQMALHGTLVSANLVEGYAIVRSAENE